MSSKGSLELEVLGGGRGGETGTLRGGSLRSFSIEAGSGLEGPCWGGAVVRVKTLEGGLGAGGREGGGVG